MTRDEVIAQIRARLAKAAMLDTASEEERKRFEQLIEKDIEAERRARTAKPQT